MADFSTGAGGTFSLSAGIPATFDAAGYGALTFTKVGKITKMTGVARRRHNFVTVNYIETGGEDVAKGSYSLGETALTLTLDEDDAGQALLDAANDSTATYSVKLMHPTRGTRYAQALVSYSNEDWGDNDNPSIAEITVRYKVASSTEDGIVDVAAS